jgi:hypothetical protein
MRKQLVATALVTLSLAFGGAAFAQTQNSSDAGKHEDPDASSDVRNTPIPFNQAGPAAQSTDAGHHEDPDAASDARQQAMTPKPPQPVGPPADSIDAGHHEDPDAASDAHEASPTGR